MHGLNSAVKRMTEQPIKPPIIRSATTGSVESTTEHTCDATGSPGNSPLRVRKSISLDTGEAEHVKKVLITQSGSFKRRSIRRRSSKRINRSETEFGNDTEKYETIRERVLQERAVTNAIDALQERWRMIMFMYEDCVELNEGRRERKLKTLCVQRQFELILIISMFVLICLPVVVIFVVLCR